MQTWSANYHAFARREIHRLCQIFLSSKYIYLKRVENVFILVDGYRRFRYSTFNASTIINFYRHLTSCIWLKLVRTVYSASVIRRLSIRRWKVEDKDPDRLSFLLTFYRNLFKYSPLRVSYLIVPIIDSTILVQDVKFIIYRINSKFNLNRVFFYDGWVIEAI